jgi:hypothetical protein
LAAMWFPGISRQVTWCSCSCCVASASCRNRPASWRGVPAGAPPEGCAVVIRGRSVAGCADRISPDGMACEIMQPGARGARGSVRLGWGTR